MKKIILMLCFTLSIYSIAIAQEKIDVTKMPEAMAEKEFVFPDFNEGRLFNELKVFIAEDHEQPVVSFQLLIPGGNSMDGEKPGIASITATLLTKGAAERNALQIAQKLDGVGASLNASSGTDYIAISGFCLKKHLPVVLDVLEDVVTKPKFPKEELEKLVPQLIANLKSEKAQPTQVAGKLARMILYGEKHPYALRMTEESIKSITINDIKEYYAKYFKPNHSSIVFTGDITKNEITKKLEKTFSKWKKSETPKFKLHKPQPEPLGIYFVNRPASVQSTVMIAMKGIPVYDDDYESLSLASQIIGAGFAGRLFRTLREKYSYTYSPWGRLTSNKYDNIFMCGADVRNSVTDSAISVIMEQLNLLSTEQTTEDELNRVKSYVVGEYLMAFERAGFLGDLIQDADFNGIPFAKLRTYSKRMMNTNSYDIIKVAERYMKINKAYIIVVGNEEVKSKLAQFGKLYEYDLDLNSLTGEKAKMEKVSLTSEELFEKMTDAIGGKDAINKIGTMVNEGTASLAVQGRNLSGKHIQKYKSPNKKVQTIDLGMFKQSMWVDGTSAWIEAMGTIRKLEGKELDKMLADATMFNELKLLQRGYKCQVLGKLKDVILLKAVSEAGVEMTYYIDANTFIIKKIETIEPSSQGPMPITMEFSGYTLFEGVLMPKIVETTNPMFTIKADCTYKFNVPLDDSEFLPPQPKQ